MSLTHWVEWDRELFNKLFDKPKDKLVGELKAPPLTKNYSTVGTAFDYAIRFYLSCINHKSNYFSLVAEFGVRDDKKRKRFIDDFERKRVGISNKQDVYKLLPDCIILAHLDSVYRNGRDFPNSDIFRIDDADVQDLRKLLDVIPEDVFKSQDECYLNPGFGETSKYIGGADADLVIDGCLIDIKTTKYLEFTKDHFRQLMGYYILNEREWEERFKVDIGTDDCIEYPVGYLNKLGVYFSRYGLLHTFNIPPCKLENGYSDISLAQREQMDEDERGTWMLLLMEDTMKDYRKEVLGLKE
jgi:hypothetical protein